MAVRSLYDRSRRLLRDKSDCPLSPALFIIVMDRISRRSQRPEGVRFGDHMILSLLFSDDIVLLAPSDQDLRQCTGTVCDWDENQLLQVRGHGAQSVKGGLPASGWWSVPATSGGV